MADHRPMTIWLNYWIFNYSIWLNYWLTVYNSIEKKCLSFQCCYIL